jgi:hypothetical protein
LELFVKKRKYMDINPDILRRYWTGKCTDEEIRMVKIWMEAGQPNEKYSAGNDLSPEAVRDELWSSIARQAGIQTSSGKSATKSKRLWAESRLTYGMIAASLVMVVLWVYTRPAGIRKNEIAYREVQVPNGQKRTLILPELRELTQVPGPLRRYPPPCCAAGRGFLLGLKKL